MAGPIVVGVDGSRAAQQALRWALTEAASRDCPVHAVHAWNLGRVHDFQWASRRSLRADSQALLRTAVAACRHTEPRVPVSCHSVEGQPGPALVAAAREASLLVLGTHRGGSGGLGALARFCVRHLTVPVVVIPAESPARSPA